MAAKKSNLQKKLESGIFSVTAEIGPPMSANDEFVRKRARPLHGIIDAANVTDNQTAIVRMSSIAVLVDQLEKLSFKIRPREVEKGKTSRVYKSFLNEVLFTKGSRKIKQLQKTVL
jgi:hypothetical protein